MSGTETPIDPLIDVTAKVLQSRLPDFYAAVGEFTQPATAVAIDEEPTTEWTADDVDLARKVWAKLSSLAKQMFQALVDADGGRLSAQELMVHLDLNEASQVAGALAWPRQHAKKVGRKLPVSAKVTDSGTYYWFEPVVLDLFKTASQEG